MLVYFLINLGQHVVLTQIIIGCIWKSAANTMGMFVRPVSTFGLFLPYRACKERRIVSMRCWPVMDAVMRPAMAAGQEDKKHGSMTVYFTRGQTRYRHRLAAKNAQARTVTS